MNQGATCFLGCVGLHFPFADNQNQLGSSNPRDLRPAGVQAHEQCLRHYRRLLGGCHGFSVLVVDSILSVVDLLYTFYSVRQRCRFVRDHIPLRAYGPLCVTGLGLW